MFILGGHDIKEGSTDSLWMLDLSKISTMDSQITDVGDHMGISEDKRINWQKVETSGKEKPGKFEDFSIHIK